MVFELYREENRPDVQMDTLGYEKRTRPRPRRPGMYGICFEDEDVLRLTGDDLVSVLADYVEDLCSLKSGGEQTDVLLQSFGRRNQTLKIKDYILRLYKYLDCSDACYIIALVYMERLRARTRRLSSYNNANMHRIFAVSMLLAIKYLEDVCYTNDDYATVFGMRGIQEINLLEKRMLSILGFNLYISTAEYFDLKARLVRDHLYNTARPRLTFQVTRSHGVSRDACERLAQEA
ncbi:hypothetical protein NDN08_002119 [Rhodosorus marinus]|uniref:Cyclin n=1 Tax=Rhodosorus marinus TaxID=101924 RepID=A0AAV8USX9_9RHOD|nr:hypothetical protein NDN08_002119 [Rhodosorus marinus]